MTNQQINTVIPGRDYDGTFLYYLLRHEAPRIAGLAGGAATPILNKSDFSGISVRVPGLTTQQSISGVLGAIDDLIENNRRRAEVLEEMTRAIYRDWFVRFRYPDHEDGLVVDSPLGLIPQGWRTSSFADLASFVNGFAFSPAHWGSDGRPIIKIKELKQGVTHDTPRYDEMAIEKKYWIEPGDLLFSWSAYLGVFRWMDEPGLLNQHLFLVTPRHDLSVAFLQHALDVAMPQFWDRAQGTTMRHIKRSALNEVLAVLPPPHLVDAFTDTVEPLMQDALVLQQAVHRLSNLRDVLLPKLVTGRIDVSELNLDAVVEGAIG